MHDDNNKRNVAIVFILSKHKKKERKFEIKLQNSLMQYDDIMMLLHHLDKIINLTLDYILEKFPFFIQFFFFFLVAYIFLEKDSGYFLDQQLTRMKW